MPIIIQSSDEINVQFSLSGSITIGGGNTNPGNTETDPTVPAHVKAIAQADIDNWNAKADEAYTDNAIDALKDGVPSAGDTLMKLFNLFVGLILEVTVNDIAARDAYHAINGMHVFVLDDGDGNWALYKATSSGVGASYVKLSDPDLLNAVMTAAQIKAAYESNSNTNAFTDALLAKLNGALPAAVFTDALLNANQSTNSTSLGNVAGMSFAVDAGKTYVFEMYGRMGSSDTPGGRIALTFPSGAVCEYQTFGNLGGSGNSFVARGHINSGQETLTMASSTAQANYMFFIKGSIVVGANAGTVQMQFRSLSTGTTFTIYAGAVVRAREI